ncbi:hypothetical protein GCWU000182_01084 [Abiotrophia defectiva ATCC 49176]|uniref:Uncharacterized protein n=1 Tax=Abiotrophia defectiva ATCC 49176 TaxID=592010 RepID=W1Q374_ABIDE|nr:hypothetical protein GCWU000182_01084 [Abiotrophia defectiva ATCC 49176]
MAAVAALGKARPLWLTDFSQPAAVFRLGGLWWPKSLCSKATHTPAILMPQGLLCPAAALPSLESEKFCVANKIYESIWLQVLFF